MRERIQLIFQEYQQQTLAKQTEPIKEQEIPQRLLEERGANVYKAYIRLQHSKKTFRMTANRMSDFNK